MPIEYINVRYSKNRYGIIPRRLLGQLIASHKIKQFYRESEKRWVTIGVNPIRKGIDSAFHGPERRSPSKVRISFDIAI